MTLTGPRDPFDSRFWSNAILSATYPSAESLCWRNISSVVLHNTLNIAPAPPRLTADWERDVASQLQLEPGDVEPLSLPRARQRWPGYAHCMLAVTEWLRNFELQGLLPEAPLALMACRGARYHHDAALYGAKAFCNIFVSEDKGLDLVFPHTGLRMPLVRGTVLVFDTGQPHGVVRRGSQTFEIADFATDQDVTEVFLTWELPIEDPQLARLLGIRFDVRLTTLSKQTEGQLFRNDTPAALCGRTGAWQPLEATGIDKGGIE